MIAWNALVEHIKMKYPVTDETAEMISIITAVADDRRQSVYIRKLSTDGADWLEISTPVCVESDLDPRDALERNAAFVTGSLALLRSGTVVYRHSLPLQTTAESDAEGLAMVDALVQSTAQTGDELELELTGADNF